MLLSNKGMGSALSMEQLQQRGLSDYHPLVQILSFKPVHFSEPD